uniref:Uncharacterized protein n=1 Tax=Strongyloides stercoralis TaxID=6248 RepID=A0AAF5DEJ0_STRER
CATFLLLIRITFEPQLIETFVVSSIVDLLWCSTGAGFGAHWRLNNADYNKEFIHYYCCIGGCCSTGTEAEAWRFFWRKLEDVGLLELNFKHGAFFLMGEIYLSMEDVVEGIGGCCSTDAESKTCKLFFGRNSFRISASYNSETSYDKESSYCYRCFRGCYSTGAESGEWRLFWKKVENSIEDVVEGVGGCCSTGAGSKTCKLFFVRNSFINNAKYDKQSRYYCCGFGDCCSTGTDSEALRFFWKKLEDSMKAVVEEVGGCCSTEAESKTYKLFSFGRNLFKINVSYDKEFRINANYDKETRYYCCCFGGCYSTGAESGEWRLFCKKFEDSMKAVVEEIGGCCSTGAELKTRQLFSFGRNSFSNNAKYDKQSSMEAVVEGIRGCCSIGAEPKTCKLFFGRNSFRINACFDSETSYDKESRGCCLTGTDSEALRGIRNCCSAGAGSGAWDDHFWSEQEAFVLLKLGLKDGNSPVMQCRLIETVSETRMFSRNRLGAVVLLRPNLNMAVPLEQTGSCGLY